MVDVQDCVKENAFRQIDFIINGVLEADFKLVRQYMCQAVPSS